MNFDDDALEAPVWDELSTQLDPQDTHHTATEPTQDTLHQAATFQDVAADPPVFNSEPTVPTEDAEQTLEPAGNHLLDALAPETDPLSHLQEHIDNNLQVKSANLDEPLFSGSMLMTPPVVDLGSDEKQKGWQTATARRKSVGVKTKKLFDGSRLRRRAKPTAPTENIIPGEPTTQDDPLLKAQLNNNSGSLSPVKKKEVSSKQSKNSKDILRQFNEPLFHLPSEKPSSTDHDAVPVERKAEEEEEEETESEENLVAYEIEVKDPVEVKDFTTKYTEYTVICSCEALQFPTKEVKRRYRDFRWLYRQLQNNHWGRIIPPPPEKQTIGRFAKDFIEQRRYQMENMLVQISNNIILQKDPDFITFLTSDNFVSDSKLREHVTGSGAYNDNNDLTEIHISDIKLLGPDDAKLVAKNGGLDVDNTKSFMGMAFSSLPKYVEQDEYLIHENEKIVILEDQLTQLYKSIETVDTQRSELSSSIQEFANMIRNLASLEATKKSSDLLNNFAEVHDRIRLSLERNSLQEVMTISVTLEEYIRSLSSIKATFNQRYKLGYYLGIVEADLNKKRQHLKKFINSGDSASDKYKMVADDCKMLQNRYDKILKSWKNILKTIRFEIKKFDTVKINDFRNTIEISLENAIETQKECIELWETFYQTNL